MVLFVIVIMLLDPFSEVTLRNESRLWVLVAALLGAGLFGILWAALHAFQPAAPAAAAVPDPARNTEALAAVLFQKYLLPFEAVSILILVAIIGAVILAKKRGRGGAQP
jgi:NADH-quinone oxidoreductase subunit J